MNSILEEISNIESQVDAEEVKIDESGYSPKFDGEWYCP
jgi:hypothetical protein